MAQTPGYDPSGLAPRILIRDIDGVLQYTFEADQIAASPTQDFVLRSGAFHLGINDDPGQFVFIIEDNGNALTDGTSLAKPLIKQQWQVELWLGKDSSNLNRWFYGTVMEVTIARPITNRQQIRVSCGGWSVKLLDRYTNIKRFQEKESNGTDLDNTDANAKVSELVKDVIQDDDHYITEGLAGQSELTVTGVKDIDIKLADFQQTGQSWAGAISTLAAWANAYWGVDADRDVYFHQVGTEDSGFLFTNDLDGLDAQNWDADKIGYLDNVMFDFSNNSGNGAFSVLHGLGGNEIKLDINVNPTPNSLFTMETDWLAFKITPTFDNIEKIALSLNKTGTPTEGRATFIIVGDDGSGGPNIDDVRGVGYLGESKLTALPTSGTNWVEIGFDIKGGVPVSPREELFIVIKKYGTASHNFAIENDTAIDTTYWTSTDPAGVGWTTVSGASGVSFLHRVYANRPVTVTLEDLAATRKYGVREMPFVLRQDVQVETIQEALIQASEQLGKEQRVYQNIVISPVTDRIPLGKYARVQDSLSGLDTNVDVVAVDANFSADDTSNVGIEKLTLTLQEIQG